MFETVEISVLAETPLFRLEAFDEPAVDAWALAQFGTRLPAPCCSAGAGSARLIWVEPKAWHLRTPDPCTSWPDPSAAAVTELTGGRVCLGLRGSGWRELLTLEGVFDVEDRGFGPGSAATTLIHHTTVLLDVVSDDRAEVWVAPSYLNHIVDFWTAALARGALKT